MQKSETIGELAAALAIAQGAFVAVERNREVEVTMKSGGKYSFAYATMDTIVDAIRKPLSDNGLSYIQGVNGSENGTVVETMLLHKSGEWINTTTPVRIEGSGAQAVGSGITYAKRYGLTALVGIVTEDDDDGNDADNNAVKTKKLDHPTTKRPVRSADDPKWRGPLNKTALKDRINEMVNDIRGVEDIGSFWAVLAQHQDILEQCPADLPEWWIHKTGGVKGAIYQKGTELKAKVTEALDGYEKASERAPLKAVTSAAE